MFHINEFSNYPSKPQIKAAYTAEAFPKGNIIGRSGNAVLVDLEGGDVAVVSRPRVEGDIGHQDAPAVDLHWAFGQ